MESWNRAPIREHSQPEGTIRRYAGGEPAVSDASERLSNGLPRLFCAIPLYAAGGSTVWRRHAVLYRREQSLQWPSIDRNEASRSWPPGASQLYLESLPGHGLEWRIPAVLCRRSPVTSTWRA